MYAIVQIGSAQYKVSQGDTIETHLLESKEGADITFDQVILLCDNSTVKIGQPFLKEVKVLAKVVRHNLAAKVLSYKYRPKKDSAWKKGHRQKLTTLTITKIAA
ncbi:MAG TPA: 50S ribosomal protein L21 [Candidatus Omnitrophota bacterium]|nr:50S ribosomal protein L21 [Candidatus Omnitrophota bacterium]HPD83989.1 50S ribosomal protein L21 [Candidatus Omnitrophota bacterium]HRZ02846.1 50S ribosomal protein L21 [Candidatus Omnitrophota bacterium]